MQMPDFRGFTVSLSHSTLSLKSYPNHESYASFISLNNATNLSTSRSKLWNFTTCSRK